MVIHSHDCLPIQCMLYTLYVDNDTIVNRKLWLQYLFHGTLIGPFQCMTEGCVHVALDTSFNSNGY